ncbi:MAG: DUF4864 domain-containing protein [Roseinatronobacter sp.]
MTAVFRRFALCFLLVVPVPAFADPIQKVISDQIAAFMADDFETAFTFASPSIKRMFGSPERFGQMVRDGYPMVHRPADVQMLEQQTVGPHVIQRVMMRDATGRVHFLAYAMVETPEGWQINGVQILRAPEVGA